MCRTVAVVVASIVAAVVAFDVFVVNVVIRLARCMKKALTLNLLHGGPKMVKNLPDGL